MWPVRVSQRMGSTEPSRWSCLFLPFPYYNNEFASRNQNPKPPSMAMPAAAAAPAAESGAFGGVDAELLEPMERAAGAGNVEATTTLLAAGASLNAQAGSRPLGRTVLHWAVWSGNKKVIRLVVMAIGRTIPNPAAQWQAMEARCLSHEGGRDGTTPLHLASERGHVEVAAGLLKVGVSADLVDGYEHTALDLAVDANNEEMVAALVWGGAEINAAANSMWHAPLHRAVLNNNLAMCEVLLREGARVDAHDQNGEAPVHTASRKGFGRIISALAAAGADLRAEDRWYRPPMVHACDSDDPESSIRALVAEGVSPWVMTPQNLCTVQLAALQDQFEALWVMLDVGVDPNHRFAYDEEDRRQLCSSRYMGPSLLFLAALAASEGVVRLLLSAGANEGIPALDSRSCWRGAMTPTIPADVVGKWDYTMPDLPKAELDRRVVSVRAMLV